MTTERLSLGARLAVSEAMQNEVLVMIGFLILVGFVVAWLSYVLSRWSWVPRKKHDRTFTERF